MKSFITSMLPDALQDLLKWIPSQAWKAIDWKPLAAQAMVLSARAISNQAPRLTPQVSRLTTRKTNGKRKPILFKWEMRC